jgi:hypothetical protein
MASPDDGIEANLECPKLERHCKPALVSQLAIPDRISKAQAPSTESMAIAEKCREGSCQPLQTAVTEGDELSLAK